MCLEDRDILDNIKMDLEETGLVVSTGFEYRSKEGSSGCLNCHSNESLDFVREVGQWLWCWNEQAGRFHPFYRPRRPLG